MQTRYIRIDGVEHVVRVNPGLGVEEGDRYRMPLLDGEEMEGEIRSLGDGVYSVLLGNESIRVVITSTGTGLEAICAGVRGEITSESERDRLLKRYGGGGGEKDRHTEIRAPMPALVVQVEVAPGDSVETGGGLVILEAMKMENELRAHHPGIVKEVCVEKGMTVEKGALLLRLE